MIRERRSSTEFGVHVTTTTRSNKERKNYRSTPAGSQQDRGHGRQSQSRNYSQQWGNRGITC